MRNLKDRNILVTRPAGLERNLMQMIADAGAVPVHLPAIAIVPPADDTSRRYVKSHFSDYDIAIFISPTSVQQTLAYMDIDTSHCKLAAIGSRSQKALEAAGLKVGIQPHGHDSESLLEHADLQAESVAGKNIVIFRGEDGRDILGDELDKRGARITYAAIYTRIRPDVMIEPTVLNSLDAITISSNEGLQNLYDIVKDSAIPTGKLVSISIYVPGNRARKLATQLGFTHIVMADNATDQAMLKALQHNHD